jgi:hypothetical protein
MASKGETENIGMLTSIQMIDFETASNASFEEVHAGLVEAPLPATLPPSWLPSSPPVLQTDVKPEAEAQEDEDVPPILYVLQFLGFGNRILECRFLIHLSHFLKVPLNLEIVSLISVLHNSTHKQRAL